jgi:AcrR family transcriptional regulator
MELHDNRRSTATRDRIVAATTKLVHRDGVAGVTVRAIAAESGVSPGRVIQLFGSKDRVLLEVFLNGRRAYVETLDIASRTTGGVEALLTGAFNAMFDFDTRQIDLMRAVFAYSWTWGPEEEALFRENSTPVAASFAEALARETGTRCEAVHFSASHACFMVYNNLLRAYSHVGLNKDAMLTTMLPVVRMLEAGLRAVGTKA